MSIENSKKYTGSEDVYRNMRKERELLERALECWELQMDGVANRGFNTFEEIRAYLAEPEVKREPLSEEDACEGYITTIKNKPWTCRKAYFAGIRFAEEHHGT